MTSLHGVRTEFYNATTIHLFKNINKSSQSNTAYNITGQ